MISSNPNTLPNSTPNMVEKKPQQEIMPANRIADMDRRGEKWRIFNEINVVNLQYKPIPYTDWQPLPSGLNGSVRLIPVTYK